MFVWSLGAPAWFEIHQDISGKYQSMVQFALSQQLVNYVAVFMALAIMLLPSAALSTVGVKRRTPINRCFSWATSIRPGIAWMMSSVRRRKCVVTIVSCCAATTLVQLLAATF